MTSPRPPLDPSSLEQRREVRRRAEAPAIFRVQGRSGPFLATVLDVSVSGLRLSSPVAFPVGSKLTVKCFGVEVPGEIRYARAIGEGAFHLGILASPDADGEPTNLLRRFGLPDNE